MNNRKKIIATVFIAFMLVFNTMAQQDGDAPKKGNRPVVPVKPKDQDPPRNNNNNNRDRPREDDKKKPPSQ